MGAWSHPKYRTRFSGPKCEARIEPRSATSPASPRTARNTRWLHSSLPIRDRTVQVSHAVRHVSVRTPPAVLVAGTFPVWKPVTLGYAQNQVFLKHNNGAGDEEKLSLNSFLFFSVSVLVVASAAGLPSPHSPLRQLNSPFLLDVRQK